MFVFDQSIVTSRRKCLASLGAGWAAGMSLGEGLVPGGWDAFIARLSAAATKLDEPTELEEDAYVLEAAAGLLRASPHAPAVQAWKTLASIEGAAVAALHRRAPLYVARFRLKAKAPVPLHDHAGYSVAFLVTKGELAVQSYDPLPQVESKRDSADPRLRPIAKLEITPGRVGTLSSRRENFHAIQAGAEEVEGLEIFTRTGKGPGTRFYRIVGQPDKAGVVQAERTG